MHHHIAMLLHTLDAQRGQIEDEIETLRAIAEHVPDLRLDSGRLYTRLLDITDDAVFEVVRGGEGRFDDPAFLYATPARHLANQWILYEREYALATVVGHDVVAEGDWEVAMQGDRVPPAVVERCRSYLRRAGPRS